MNSPRIQFLFDMSLGQFYENCRVSKKDEDELNIDIKMYFLKLVTPFLLSYSSLFLVVGLWTTKLLKHQSNIRPIDDRSWIQQSLLYFWQGYHP